ncbi:MAG: hydrogenase maturation protease [Candidatus Altiarchaeota archaeon]|nr:hydrogenase maturation protease [Candidatus Altiarchaeota archaeon]
MISILAIGNDLREDDEAGLYAGKLLEKRGISVVFAYEQPENVLGQLRQVNKLLILDAAHFEGERPYLVTREVPSKSFYTHKLDLNKIKKFTGAEVRLIGIKTYNRRLGEKISEQVKANAREAVKVVEVCMAIPGKILNKEEKIVEIGGEEKKVKFGLPGLKKGDFVLIHAGIVIEKMSEEEYKTISEEMKEFIL